MCSPGVSSSACLKQNSISQCPFQASNRSGLSLGQRFWKQKPLFRTEVILVSKRVTEENLEDKDIGLSLKVKELKKSRQGSRVLD
jgi:hypothetical protein